MIGIMAASIIIIVMLSGLLSVRESQKREAIRIPVEVEVIRRRKRME